MSVLSPTCFGNKKRYFIQGINIGVNKYLQLNRDKLTHRVFHSDPSSNLLQSGQLLSQTIPAVVFLNTIVLVARRKINDWLFDAVPVLKIFPQNKTE